VKAEDCSTYTTQLLFVSILRRLAAHYLP